MPYANEQHRLIDEFSSHLFFLPYLWCFLWSGIGIAAGTLSAWHTVSQKPTRTQYLTTFAAAWFMAATVALILARLISGEPFDFVGPMFYTLGALFGLGLGLSGEFFYRRIFKIPKDR